MSALGALLAMRGDLDAAETWLRRAVESGVAGALFNLGRVLEMRAFIQNRRRGHYELGLDAPPVVRVAAAFTELAQAI
jgi:hypothetical protein